MPNPGARPFTAFNFAVEIRVDGVAMQVCDAAFSECDGLEMTMDVKTIREGGNNGKEIEVAQGDVAVLPAGTGHQCLWASPDLMVIGAYPKQGRYDLCRGSKQEYSKALETIPQVPLPDSDPVFGNDGPLLRLWRD